MYVFLCGGDVLPAGGHRHGGHSYLDDGRDERSILLITKDRFLLIITSLLLNHDATADGTSLNPNLPSPPPVVIGNVSDDILQKDYPCVPG